jgi:hypothetical protein
MRKYKSSWKDDGTSTLQEVVLQKGWRKMKNNKTRENTKIKKYNNNNNNK